MKTAAVVGVGDELLSGVVVNSNAALIGRRLLDVGVPVVRSFCVGDEEDLIVEVVRQAAELADVVVVTGGLGPTQDDRTREALARMLGVPLVRDAEVVESIRARFAAFGREMPESNARQADRPESAAFVQNPWGTAPGLRAEWKGTVVYAIPGVPREAEHMLEEQILPQLAGHPIATRELRCVGIAESELAERLSDLAVAAEPRMAFLPGGGEVRLRFVGGGKESLERAEAIVRERLGPAVYGHDDQTLEAVVGLLLAGAGHTLAVAESCTAGMLASRIATVPGASAYLRGGIVAYQNDVKAKGLGISPALIAASGPVSGEVALEMARGARVAFEADLGIAVTCVAGPEPHGGQPVGRTVLALAGLNQTDIVRELRLPGDREQVRQFATTFALNLLRLHLLGEPLR